MQYNKSEMAAYSFGIFHVLDFRKGELKLLENGMQKLQK